MSTITIDLTGIAHGGAAIGRHEGRMIFVHHAIPGERVQARIVKDKGRVAIAVAENIIQPSPHRVTPPCDHFAPGGCAGCQWQHIDYAAQVRFKEEIIADQLQRIGKLKNPPVLPIIAAPIEYGYRTRSTFTPLPLNEELVEEMADEDDPGAEEYTGTLYGLGLPGEDPVTRILIEDCPALTPALDALRDSLQFTDPNLHEVTLQAGSEPDDTMLIIQTADDKAPSIETDLAVSINLLFRDNEPVNLIGGAQVHYDVLGRRFRVTAGGFYRENPAVVPLLVEAVLDALDINEDDTVLDLYSGVGVFTAFLAERAGLVVSVESYPPAVTDADINLETFDNIDLVEGGVEAVLPDLKGPFDVVLVDPPGSGMSREVVDALARLKPPQIVYVSSDPATLARDLRSLVDKGYDLISVQPFDAAPQTFYIEAVAMLRRRS